MDTTRPNAKERDAVPAAVENVRRCEICGGTMDRRGAVIACRDGAHFSTEWGGMYDCTPPRLAAA